MRRRLLVNGIDTIYNNTTRRNNLVAWANAKGFDTFEYPYGLGQNGDSLDAILAPSGPGSFNNTNSTNFASFITYCRNHNIPNHVAIRDITTTELNNPPYGDKLINQYHSQQANVLATSFYATNSGLHLDVKYWILPTAAQNIPVFNSNFIPYINAYFRWKMYFTNNFHSKPHNEVNIGKLMPGYEYYQAVNIVKQGLPLHLDYFDMPYPNSTSETLSSWMNRTAIRYKNRLDVLGQAFHAGSPNGKYDVSLHIHMGNHQNTVDWYYANIGYSIEDVYNAFVAAFNALPTFPGKQYINFVGYLVTDESYAMYLRP